MKILTESFRFESRNCWICVPDDYKEHKKTTIIFLPSGNDITSMIPSIVEKLQFSFKDKMYTPFLLAGFESDNWERDFTPWPAPKLFNKADDFTGEAATTLNWILGRYKPIIEEKYFDGISVMNNSIIGYSLGGLFALWAFFESDIFQSCASCSGSLWYDDLMEYISSCSIRENSRIYLSLGNNEEKAKNKRMSLVGDNTRQAAALFEADKNIMESKLQWHTGGHFSDVDKRIVDGLLWLVKSVFQ